MAEMTAEQLAVDLGRELARVRDERDQLTAELERVRGEKERLRVALNDLMLDSTPVWQGIGVSDQIAIPRETWTPAMQALADYFYPAPPDQRGAAETEVVE